MEKDKRKLCMLSHCGTALSFVSTSKAIPNNSIIIYKVFHLIRKRILSLNQKNSLSLLFYLLIYYLFRLSKQMLHIFIEWESHFLFRFSCIFLYEWKYKILFHWAKRRQRRRRWRRQQKNPISIHLKIHVLDFINEYGKKMYGNKAIMLKSIFRRHEKNKAVPRMTQPGFLTKEPGVIAGKIPLIKSLKRKVLPE